MSVDMMQKIGWLHRISVQERLSKIFIYAVLCFGAAIILLPFFWMVSTSLKLPGREFSFPVQWIPDPITFSNYTRGWTSLPFSRWALNTIYITGLNILGQVISVTLVGYGFARLRFPGRDVLFLLCIATMILPYQVTMIPIFILFRYLGWVDTYKPLIIPSYFAVGGFFVFLIRQFFLTIPVEMEDSAKIDGCGHIGAFFRIILPLSKPAIGIITVFTFMAHWNNFLYPLIYLSSFEKFTLSLGLRFFQGQFNIKWTFLMAISIIALIPSIVIFVIAQKYYIRGIVITGVKG